MMPVRLRRVTGHEGRANDTLFQPAARAPPLSQHTLVFFGGDVQDYPEVMQAHRDNRNYVKWNLESMVRMLGNSFPTKHILVVRPSRYIGGSRIEYKSFSCYDNFVPSNNAGVPEHTPTHGALLHLERLLQGVSNRIKSFSTSELIEAFSPVTLPEDIDIEDLHNSAIHPAEASKSNGTKASGSGSHEQDPELVSRDPPEHKPCSDTDPLWWRDKFSLDETQLTLVGFSKGCVVLNQLIYEFHYVKTLTPGDAHTMRFMSRIADMYWLDGGHAGGKNTWITSRSLLETLTRLNVNVFVHVSPYQVQDESRPWIGREEKAFTGLLKKLGAKVNRYLHDQPGMAQSLHMHFEVLANFKTMQDCIPVAMPDTSDEEA